MSTTLRLAAVAGLVLVMGAAPATGSARTPSPVPRAPDASSTVHGWVGARGGPAGLYSWPEGGRSWMHNVSVEGSGPIEITFGTLDAPYGIPVDDIGLAGAHLAGSYRERPERVTDVRMQAWILDVDASRVVIIVKAFPDTAPALVAEAEAIVRSIRVERSDTSAGHRLVFELPAGWDSG
jgi:hypothetical protein